MSAIAATDPQLVGPPCSTSFTHWLTGRRPHAIVALAQQRVRRAAWIAREGLSAIEAAHIPLEFDPTPEHITRE